MTAFFQSILQGIWVFTSIFLTRGVFLFLLVLLVTRISPWLTAGVRHALWFGVLWGFFLLPAASVVLPVITLEGTRVHGTTSAYAALLSPLSYRQGLETSLSGPLLLHEAPAASGASVAVAVTVSILYLGGVLFCLLRPLAAWRALRRLAAGARPMATRALAPRRLARRLGIGRQVFLLVHDQVAIPFTFGVLRPHVVLPAVALDWPADRLRAVVVHELAHVKRGDCLLNWVSYALCTLLWFLPAAWFARACMRREAEMSCDRRVLEQGFSRPKYAATLLDLVSRRDRRTFLGASGFLDGGTRIEDRIRRILSPVIRAPGKALVLVVCLGLLGLASIVSIRQTEKLFGSWVNRGSSGPALYAWLDNGTGHEFARSYESNDAGIGQRFAASLRYLPCSTGAFVIDREWTDARKNTWYEVRTRWTSSDTPRFALIRLDASGTSYESDESWVGYPSTFAGPVGTGSHQVYSRP